MTTGRYTQELDALEDALAVLTERLDASSISEGASEETTNLQRKITRLQENQAEAKQALDEATRLVREILNSESA